MSVSSSIRARLDPARPDPFDHAGYLGLFDRSAERAKYAEFLRSTGREAARQGTPGGEVEMSPDVAYYEFANGYGAGVLLGSAGHLACSSATAAYPLEMAVLHGPGLHLCYRTALTGGDATICPLARAGVRRTLDEIAALAPVARCGHQRPTRS